jgi:hypothetical protein
MMLDFDLSPHLEPLSHALLHMLAFEEHTLADLQEHALLETVYRSPHATTAVRTMLAKASSSATRRRQGNSPGQLASG